MLRFQGGSLLKVGLLDAGDCVETMAVPPRAQCTVNFIVMGGTGRFQGASGTITLTEAVVPVLAGAAGNPAHFATTGTFTISGAAADEKAPEGR